MEVKCRRVVNLAFSAAGKNIKKQQKLFVCVRVYLRVRSDDKLRYLCDDVRGSHYSLSKSRKKLGSCSRSVHVKTFSRFPMF